MADADAKERKEREAQEMDREPITDALNAQPVGGHPLGTGIGAASGLIAGAVVGAIGGPLGSAIGGLVGAVAGGIAGNNAGELVNPAGADVYWSNAYRNEPYYDNLYRYDDYAPAYRAGHAHRENNFEGFWEQAEIDLKSAWEHSKSTSRLTWEEAKHAAHAAWHRVERPKPIPQPQHDS